MSTDDVAPASGMVLVSQTPSCVTALDRITTTIADARIEAEALLAQHASGVAVHIFDQDRRLVTIRRAEAERE